MTVMAGGAMRLLGTTWAAEETFPTSSCSGVGRSSLPVVRIRTGRQEANEGANPMAVISSSDVRMQQPRANMQQPI